MPRKPKIDNSSKYKQTSINNYFRYTSTIQMLRVETKPDSIATQMSKSVSLRFKLPSYLSDSEEDSTAIENVRKQHTCRRLCSDESDDGDFIRKTNKASRLRPKSRRCVKVNKKELRTMQNAETDSSSDVEFISFTRGSIDKENKKVTNSNTPRITIGVYSPVKEDDNGSKLITPELTLDKTLENFSSSQQNERNVQTATENDTTLTNCHLSPINQRSLQPEPSSSLERLNTSSPHVMAISKSDLEGNKEESPIALQVILKIIKFVIEHDHLKKLLSGHETIVLNNFFQLPRKEYIFTCLKLYTRIKKWYNIFDFRTVIKQKLSDPEVIHMYHCLSERGFVDTDYSCDPIHGLLLHLSVKTLKELCVEFKIPLGKFNKGELVDKLFNNCNRQATLTIKSSIRVLLMEAIKRKMGFCFKLNEDFFKLLNKVHLLYSFTTTEFAATSDLYLFMGRIIDKTATMPLYAIDRNVEIFGSIEEFNRFQDAYFCYISVIIAIEKKNVTLTYELCCNGYEELKKIVERNVVDSRPSYLQRFTPGHKYTKALWKGITYITKAHKESVSEWLNFLLDQRLFCQYLRGLWFDQLIMVQYAHLKRYDEATKTLIAALKDKQLKKIHLMDINKRAEKIKHCKIHKISQIEFGVISSVQPIPMENLPFREIDSQAFRSEVSGRKRNYYKKVDDGVEIYSVEEVALNYYKDQFNLNGIHCEGSLLVTLFFLLFWDIIYDDTVPSVFVSEIQYYPLDLYCSEFYVNRKIKIDQRMLDITRSWSDDYMKKFICDVWDKNSYRRSLISSIVDQPEYLFDMVLCIGRCKLSKIFGRFIEDFGGSRSGLPDLFLWNFEEKMCKFVEVKGENDHLSAKQECWLDFLRSIGADIEVCHVHTMGSKRKRRNSDKSKRKAIARKEKDSDQTSISKERLIKSDSDSES